ncbi:flavodoxin domain-containing protein [Streptomyces sp. NPDC005931]|uniref:flavodoxin domain-containing protein n=1 Tax=Streptomyces sp. NPDC005931 TaxID=3364737 RepID=UPI0036BB417F
MDVLVGYATAHGSTRAIAERITDVLCAAGLTAEARPLEEVTDAGTYRAFVLGSAVHGQSWLPAAKEFLRDHPTVLGARPVWIFSVGMPAALRGPWRRLAPRELAAIEQALAPRPAHRGHRLFSGVVSRDQFPLRARLLFRLMGGRFGDFRDWAAIDRWARGIAAELRAGG